MARARILGKKLMHSDGLICELTDLGIKEQKLRIDQSTKRDELTRIKLVNKRQRERAEKHNAIKALEYILQSQGIK